MLDVQRMMQVLINLISNAIKFSRKRGEVYIQVIKHGALEVGFANCRTGGV
jgi:signal transduction histidine kinase